ncbi:O-antigen ligase family protein [Carnobacterium maltaromaticum]|uniref:O-antigen ligase family protein n=1 Tax=Carnobacterium maltaromaticum TaxID=2751 RepID=UPI00295E4938|nr:O-antigen ligase family protein [Carnobacterium maltaromaticum]
MVVIFPLVDILNGYFLTSSKSIPIATLYRIVFFIFLIVSIVMNKVPKSNYSLVTLLFCIGNVFLFFVQNLLLQNPMSWIIEDSGVFVKYLLWVLIPYYMYQRKKIFEGLNFESMFVVINLFFTLGLLIPYVLGVGTYTYTASNAGFKGYFFAQNDLACAFITLITFSGWQLLKKVTTKWNKSLLYTVFLFLADFICLLLIGMKTGVVYGLLVVSYVLVSILLGTRDYSVVKRFWLWNVSIGMILFVSFRGIDLFFKMIEGTYNRMVYFYHLYGGDWVRLLSSSRSDYFKGGMTLFLTDKNFPVTFFWGQGFSYRVGHYGRLGLIEMDVFDIFFGLGVIGISLFIIMISYFLMIAFKKNSRSIYSLLFIVILFYSFFAGHVFFSAISSTMLGLIGGGIILSQKNEFNF